MKLAALQAALVTAATGRDEPEPALLASVRAYRSAPAVERLAAYRANIRGAHLQALDQAFPVLREVLGPRYWRQLLEQEVPVYASASPDLDAYGEFMPGLLRKVQKSRPELHDLPYLGALATLEWRVHRARFAADDPVFGWDRFTELPAETQSRAKLLRSNALSLLKFDYPVDDLWRSHHDLETVDEDGDAAIACCVHRAGRFVIDVTRIDSEAFETLQALESNCIGELPGNGSDTQAQRIFGWIQCGWITGFEVDT